MNKDTTKIQVPLNIDLRLKAEKTALSYGFSSLQEVIRVFLTGFANNPVRKSVFNFPEYEILSPDQDKKLFTMLKEAESEEQYELKDIEDIFKISKDVK